MDKCKDCESYLLQTFQITKFKGVGSLNQIGKIVNGFKYINDRNFRSSRICCRRGQRKGAEDLQDCPGNVSNGDWVEVPDISGNSIRRQRLDCKIEPVMSVLCKRY